MFSNRRRFTAWVVFVGSDHRRPWRIFTRRGFRHCLVILPVWFPEKKLNAKRWSLVVDPKLRDLETEVIFEPPEKLAKEALENGANCVIKIRVDRQINRDYVFGIQPLTCISVVNSILGIREWFIWTPYQLARKLLRSGGELVEVD